MTVLSVKLIVALSCISAFCLGTGVADTCPVPPSVQECTTEIDQMMIDIMHILKRGKENLSMKYPLNSCKDIRDCDPTAPSGYYWIRNAIGGATRVFCMMNTNDCGDITGGWMRAAYINMTDTANSCPVELITYTQSSTRFCGTSLSSGGCTSVNFPTYGVPFTKVCGRAVGYQYYATDAFLPGKSIESYYVEGLSVTHGTPRNHIWTFAVGLSKDYSSYTCCNCPCALYPGPAAPSFVGEDYFCESGDTGRYEAQWYLDDPLWDSQGCVHGSTCCDRGGPWFTTTLSQEVSDDIEVRWCTDSTNADVGVQQMEIYIN